LVVHEDDLELFVYENKASCAAGVAAEQERSALPWCRQIYAHAMHVISAFGKDGDPLIEKSGIRVLNVLISALGARPRHGSEHVKRKHLRELLEKADRDKIIKEHKAIAERMVKRWGEAKLKDVAEPRKKGKRTPKKVEPSS
jgi:hypothetical protein